MPKQDDGKAASEKAADSKAAENSAAPAPDEKKPAYYVDGKRVSEKEHLDALEKAGYDRATMELYPERRPVSVNTTPLGG